MKNKQLRANFFKYYDRTISNIIELEQKESFYLTAQGSRELLGTIDFVWRYEYITDKERDECFDTAWNHLLIAESKLNRLF